MPFMLVVRKLNVVVVVKERTDVEEDRKELLGC